MAWSSVAPEISPSDRQWLPETLSITRKPIGSGTDSFFGGRPHQPHTPARDPSPVQRKWYLREPLESCAIGSRTRILIAHLDGGFGATNFGFAAVFHAVVVSPSSKKKLRAKEIGS